MSEVEQRLQRNEMQVQAIDERLTRLDHGLRGNGRKGLFTEFELLKQKVAELEEFKSDMKLTKRWAAAAALTVLGQLMLGILRLALPTL